MKKTETGIDFNKSRDRLVAKQKKEDALEAGLKARKASATKAIVLGSAALGVISLSLFAVSKFRKKRS